MLESCNKSGGTNRPNRLSRARLMEDEAEEGAALHGLHIYKTECGLEATYAVPLVSRGQKVSRTKFPWHVAIFRKNEGGQFEQICGGSIVRSQIVISAAHCFSDEITNHQVRVTDYRVVGGVLHRSWNGVKTGRQAKQVLAVRLGETFGGSIRNLQDDIAIVQLTTEFTFSRVVRAVCLDLVDRELHTTQTSPGSVGKVAGWGLTEASVLSESLNFLSVPVVAESLCTELLPFNFMTYITSDKLCAGLRNGSAVCQGDSGGGLVFPLQNASTSFPRWYLRGILSNAPLSSDISSPCQTDTFALYTDIFKIGFWLSTSMEVLQPQGAACRVRGSVGVCREFSACPSAMEASSRGTLPQKCSLSSADLICCVETEDSCPPLPPSTVSQRKTGSKANDYCVDLPEKLFPCQRNSSGWGRGNLCWSGSGSRPVIYWITRISAESDNPRYAMLDFEIPASNYGAPAMLVSERWLLTPALSWNIPGPASNPFSPLGTFAIARSVPRPREFLSNLTRAPVWTLVEMDKPVTFSRSIQPLCLPTGGPLPRDSTRGLVDMITWQNEFVRKVVPVDLLSLEDCRRRSHPDRFGALDGVKDDFYICATPIEKADCHVVYYGSSLTLDNSHQVTCTRLLVGLFLDVKPMGDECTYIFIRVRAFTPWLEGVVWS